MNLASLFDGSSAAIVLGGTLVATLLHSGSADCGAALSALTRLGRRRFDADRARAELAAPVRDIRRDGILRATSPHFEDADIEHAASAMIGTRSVAALLRAHQSDRVKRLAVANRAAGTLIQAAELSPVFGLAGTLVSLSQLPADGLAPGAYSQAIGMAVLTTLYGLLLANLVFAPLARIVERAGLAEEQERQQVIDWLAGQVEPAIPHRSPPRPEAA